MSAIEFGITSHSPFLSTLMPVAFGQPLTGLEPLAEHRERLSYLSRSIASLTRVSLSSNLVALLRPLFPCDLANIIVFAQSTTNVAWRSFGAAQLAPLNLPIEETSIWSVFHQQEPLWISDWQLDERSAVRKETQSGVGYRSLCRLPLRTPEGCLGVLSLASSRPHNYSEQEVRLLLSAADQLALALMDNLNIEPPQSAQSQSDDSAARLKLLADINGSLSSAPGLDSLLPKLTVKIRRLMSSDFAILGVSNSDDGRMEVTAFDAADNTGLSRESVESWGELFWQHVLTTGKSWAGRPEEIIENHTADCESTMPPLRNSCVLPLVARDRILGMLALGKRHGAAYAQDELDYLGQVSRQVAVLLENDHLHTELQKLKQEFSGDAPYVQDDLPNEPSFEEIVGRSPALRKVLRDVEVVAPTDSGVLIQGETGTGKELIARAIHNLSTRREKPFVKLNCAAIPSGLLESELFGHEKGAFTGAVTRKPGRFEVADKGTLFLDEVGDIPLELQAKLLRVLQEHEFERLGSTRTQQVDVRVIAATHRDLKQMVEEGTFRSDLYYRIHIFPLVVPPLRDRREDIPLVVRHYVDKYAQRMNRRIETIPARTMEMITDYPWPGNIRELQNFIERAVILSPGSSLRAPLEQLKQERAQISGSSLSTLEEMEREHVLRALRDSNWVTGGPNGAAARLGMKRTTLAYRIRKLKITCRPQ